MPTEKVLNIYISSDQHEARFRKLGRRLGNTNCVCALLLVNSLVLWGILYCQHKQIEELAKEKDETAG